MLKLENRVGVAMTETNDKGGRKSLSLNKPLEMKKSAGDSGQVRQNISHGRSKTVQVEVRKKRGAAPTVSAPKAATAATPSVKPAGKKPLSVNKSSTGGNSAQSDGRVLTNDEKSARAAALQLSQHHYVDWRLA